MRRLLIVLALGAACGSPDGDPTPPPSEPAPPSDPQPPAQPPPPPRQAACFLEEGGHGDWVYHFSRVEGDCGPGRDFASNMAPGTSFTHAGPIPEVWDCQTYTNVVSSDHCQKNISRLCYGDDTYLTLVEEFHQESATRITFSFDERHAATRYTVACVGRYFGTITKQ